ncbi:hypothetical protein H6786_03190 [Candidatus Nomurabacteria bacterium]|nr:hypothetical protein [Candidatus Nomurabacteria bacterium]
MRQKDVIELTIQTDEAGQAAIDANKELLTKTVGSSAVVYAEAEGEEVKAGDYVFSFQIQKE